MQEKDAGGWPGDGGGTKFLLRGWQPFASPAFHRPPFPQRRGEERKQESGRRLEKQELETLKTGKKTW